MAIVLLGGRVVKRDEKSVKFALDAFFENPYPSGICAGWSGFS